MTLPKGLKQILGTAIGVEFAPPYAWIFMKQVETESPKTQEHKPLVWFRCIDDVFFIWTHGKGTLCLFLKDLNCFHRNIKFSHEVNKKSIQFLDLNIRLSDGNVSIDLYVKPTGRHQFIHHTSSRPDHTKHSIVFSQELRVSRICSEKIWLSQTSWKNEVMVFSQRVPWVSYWIWYEKSQVCVKK